MDSSTLFLFGLSSLIIMITPAPIMVAVITRGVGQGRKAAFLTVLGSSAGDVVQLLFVTMGLSTVLLSSVLVFKLIKYAGAAYFIYLGIRMLFRKSEFLPQSDQLRDSDPTIANSNSLSSKTLLWQGFLPSILNPDTTLFFAAFLPQFVDESKRNIATQIFSLGAVFTLIGLVVYVPIAYFSGSIGSWLRSQRLIADKLRSLMGTVFIALGIRAALQEES
ncbi:MAG: LysE family translocator [Microcoleus sp. SIO2G3]|nr:LysE family translocator [Microcoleus sp. SIO2G3]